MMTTRALDSLVDDYLARLDAALEGIPDRRRRELVADVGARIDAARLELPADSEAGVRDILATVGSPDRLAAEEHAFHPWSSRRSRVRRGAAAVIALSLVAAGSATAVASIQSAGRGSATSTVPGVVGRTEAAAAAALERAQILVGEVRAVKDPSVAAGTVVGESPPAGTSVRRGSSVDLEVAGRT